MRKVLSNRFIYWTKVVIVGLTVGVGFQLVQAWTGPSQSPPNGNVAGPITTSAIQQTKSGTLVLGTDLAVSRNTVLGQFVSTSNTTGLCLSGVCYTTWPSAPVTTVSGSGGITVSATTGNVVVSANTGILQSRVTGTCPAGQAMQFINADGSVACQSTSGLITSLSGGSGITVSPSTGAVVISPDVNYMQRRIASSCPAGQSIRAIGVDGSVTCEADDVGTGVPTGAIMMFVSACPSGWSEYTAMRGRFARGEDSGNPGSLDQGGSDDAIVVAHTHDVDPPAANTDSSGSHNHKAVAVGFVNNDQLFAYPYLSAETTAGGDTEYDLGGTYDYPTAAQTSDNGDHSHNVDVGSFSTNNAGGSGSGANRPSFQEVIYCMKS